MTISRSCLISAWNSNFCGVAVDMIIKGRGDPPSLWRATAREERGGQPSFFSGKIKGLGFGRGRGGGPRRRGAGANLVGVGKKSGVGFVVVAGVPACRFDGGGGKKPYQKQKAGTPAATRPT